MAMMFLSIDSRVDWARLSTSAEVKSLVSMGGRTTYVRLAVIYYRGVHEDSPLILMEPALNRMLRGDMT